MKWSLLVSESGCHLHNRQVLSLLPVESEEDVCVESEGGCVKKRRRLGRVCIETDL